MIGTARLQFHKGFTLDDAVAVVPYYADLGISHLYASPLLTARAGSTHGYDIVDHNRVNPELGGEAALHRLVDALRARGMGLVLDIVPNHMGVGGADNAWWLDVLEWGRASPYAEYFDIDWDPPDAALRGRMLAPFLGTPYGEALGDLALQFDDADGRLFVAYHEHRFPITPRDYAAALLTEGGPLEPVARRFADLAGPRDAMRAEAAAARTELRDPRFRPDIDACLRAYTDRDKLHRLLERQHYRLSWWRAATDEINWRRFFDVNGLAGVRVELPDVFEATHRTVFRLYEEGLIDGVRIDHVDGLAFPRDYCRKLRRRLETARAARPEALRDAPPVIWIEKILATHEQLAQDWLTDGTTGYDFMNDASAVLHDADGEAALTALWTGLTGRPGVFDEEALPARRQILRESLSSELFVASVALHRVIRRALETRDFTLTATRAVMTELLAHFRAYRIYAGPAGMGTADQRVMDWALAGARRTVRAADRPLLELVAQLLAGVGLRAAPAGTRRQEWLRAMVKFQQLSAPTAAKSVEDTSFYRYGRLISRNEVGSEPGQFAISPAALHVLNKARQRRFPGALLATATHDHKRGEDARARLAVLSEIVPEWETALNRWMRLNAPLRRDLDGPAPDPADEIMLYQTILGAWPLDLAADDAPGPRRVRDAGRRLAREGGARSEAPQRLGVAERRVRGGLPRLPGGRARPRPADGRRVAAVCRPNRTPGGRERAVATPAAHDQPGGAGPVSGHRVLGFQPGRPRQPPPGGLRRAPGRPGRRRGTEGAADGVAGRPGQAGGPGPRDGLPRPGAGVVHPWCLRPAPHRGTDGRARHRLCPDARRPGDRGGCDPPAARRRPRDAPPARGHRPMA